MEPSRHGRRRLVEELAAGGLRQALQRRGRAEPGAGEVFEAIPAMRGHGGVEAEALQTIGL